MKSHELAKKLLERPDMEVVVWECASGEALRFDNQDVVLDETITRWEITVDMSG